VPRARKPKKLTLELGGKSPNIIFEDASIDQAVEGIIAGIFFNQGHVCCAGSRLFVQESILEEVATKLAIRMSSIRVGDPLDKNTDLGAINSRSQLNKIEEYLHAGEREGARLRVSGTIGPPAKRDPTPVMSSSSNESSASSALLPAPGYWCRPCIFEGVQPSHVIAREEIFGPVLAVMSFRTPEEAINTGEQHAVWPGCGRVDRQGEQDLRDSAETGSGRGVAQHLQQVRRGVTIRRVQGERVRARRGIAGASRIRESGLSGPINRSQRTVTMNACTLETCITA